MTGLTAPMFLAGDRGIVVTKDITLNYPTFDKFIHTHHVRKKNIDTLFSKLEQMMADTEEVEPVDTFVRHDNNINTVLGAPNDTNAVVIDPNVLQKIEFGADGPAVLHPFFEKLDQLSEKKKIVRIIHYGDSQIEGDRITGYFRNKLQGKFGGYGPGMIAAFNQYNTYSFNQQVSDNFKRYSLYGIVSKEITHKKYGSMGTFARFCKVLPDSLIDEETEKEAWIEIGASNRAYGNAKTFNRVRFFYGNCVRYCQLSVYNNDELIHEDTLRTDGSYHMIELKFDQTPEKLKYVFKSVYSPDLYGFSLDGDYGVQVDNVAMRGGSGTFLNKSDYGLLGKMYSELGVEMFIMQFGGNSVPYMEDEKEARQYANYFKSNLNALRKIKPNACILVIGPSDMSTKIDEQYQSYPILKTLIPEMKRAAFEAKAGYWDLYTLMGGENSMLAWVEKGYAGEDYTHFTPAGAKFVSELFWKAFYYEYQQYKKGAAQ